MTALRGTALVTGGASGIGRALGAALAAGGARVVLADVDDEGCERAAAEMGATARHLDVRDEAAYRALAEEIGPVDMLFGNAGISLGGRTHELTAAHWDRIVDVNLKGVVNGLLAVYPSMVERGRGHIVHTASAAGLAAPPFVAAYAATKHAVVGLSTALRPEAALHGVRVSVLCPGSVETPILDRPPDGDLPPTATPPVTARQYLGVLRQRPVPAEVVARRALRQVARNRGVIVVPRSAAALWYVHRLSPRLTELLGRTMAGRVERALLR